MRCCCIGFSTAAQCKYNSMTNECYSIDNPLKAYSKNNVKNTADISLSSVYKSKDYDHLRYSNDINEKKNIHNKPVSFHNSTDEELSKYRGYHKLNPNVPEGTLPRNAEESEDDYLARNLSYITNWNLYGGCDIETTPDEDNYPEYLFDTSGLFDADAV